MAAAKLAVRNFEIQVRERASRGRNERRECGKTPLNIGAASALAERRHEEFEQEETERTEDEGNEKQRRFFTGGREERGGGVFCVTGLFSCYE